MNNNEFKKFTKNLLVKKQVELKQIENFLSFYDDNQKILKTLKTDSVSVTKFNELLQKQL